MSLPLIITPEAEEDLAEAKAWHERKREGLGDEFVLCVEAAFDHIRRFPEEAKSSRGSGRWLSGGLPTAFFTGWIRIKSL